MNDDIVLTGWAAITVRGDFSPAQPIWPQDTISHSGQIEEFALSKYLQSPKTYLDRASALALAGCALTWHHASLEGSINADEADDWGIALGTHLGCVQTMRSFWQGAIERGVQSANGILFSHSYFNSPISLCAIEWNLRGYHGTFCHDERSGLEAMRVAFDALRLGHAQAMLCGGTEALTSTRLACEPQNMPTEASAFCLLETRAHALRRGAQVLADVTDNAFESADLEATRALFGDCGGALGALAVLQNFTSSQAAIS